MRLGRRGLVIGVLVVILVLVAAVLVRDRLAKTPLEEATELLPAGTVRVGFTDWAAVGSSVPDSDLSASSSTEDIESFLDKAFDKDFTAVSALSDSFEGLADNYGIIPLDAEWEAYAQAEDGSVDVLQLSEDVDLSALEARFAEMGYDPPEDGAGSDGVWVGTPELVVGLDVPLTPVQTNVAVVSSERLMLMSDSAPYLEDAIAVVKGDADSLGPVTGIPELVDAAGKATVASLWAGDLACKDLAMSQADPRDDAAADSLIEEAGGVSPLAGLVMAQQPDRSMVVGMYFDSEDQASDDLQPRTDLASGPAPGQGGTFPERFRVADSVADGQLVTMTLEPVKGPLLGDLGSGPVLFATC